MLVLQIWEALFHYKLEETLLKQVLQIRAISTNWGMTMLLIEIQLLMFKRNSHNLFQYGQKYII